MKHLKKICIVVLLTVFAMQTTAAAAFSACDCPSMQEEVMQMDHASNDMPCHDMQKADAKKHQDSNGNQMTDCDSCGCGHCTVTTTASLTHQLSSHYFTSFKTVTMSANMPMKSIFPYGIDYPPKRIS